MSSNNNRYMFKVYQVKDNDDKLYPLYIPSDLGIHELGKVSEDNFDYKESNDESKKQYYDIWQGGKYYKNSAPNIGFSVYGVKDKDHSLFNRNDDFNIDLEPDEWEALGKEFKTYIDDSYKNTNKYKGRYAFNETNDYDYLTNDEYSVDERLRAMHSKGHAFDAAVLSPYYYNFDTDSNFDELVDLLNFHNNYDTGKKNNVVLAAAPEDSIVKWQDVLRNKYTAQRDTPHELVTTKITPVKQFSNKKFNELSDFYKLVRKAGATGQEAFYDTFNLDPYTIVSDANLKQIMMDMSNSLPVSLGNIAKCIGRCY